MAALAAVAVVGLASTRATARADALIYDGLLQLAARPVPDDILIVAIDERSVAALGRWPWPRTRHAELLNRLAEARPAAVLYDVLFIEPQPGQDEALAQAMARSRVFTPLLMSAPGPNGAPYQATPPVPVIAAAAAAIGQVNVHPDPDGLIRRAYLNEVDGAKAWPHLVALLHEHLAGTPGRRADGVPAGGPLRLHGEMLIPYGGPAGHVRTVSFVDVLNGQLPADFIRGKVVLVGATAVGLGDRFPTPVRGGDMSGVELQANMLEALATGRIVTEAGRPATILYSLLALAALLAGFLLLRPRTNVIFGLALMGLVLAISAAGLAWLRFWLPPGAALAGLALAYPIWGWRRLEASSAYMLEELNALRAEPSLLAPAAQDLSPGGDVVERQVQLMRLAVGRVRDLRRFVTDALHGLPDATLVADLAGRVLIAGDAAARLFAGLGLQAPGHVDEIFARLSPVGEAALVLGAAQDVEVAGPGGQSFQVGQSAIRGHDGALLGWIVRFSDITVLRASQQAREEVLQLLSHDMRAPQASIIALLEGPKKTVAEDAAARIRALARRTLGLADGFVRLARAEGGDLDLEPLDAADLLVEAVDAVWPQAAAKGVALEAVDIDPDHLVAADRGLLSRALVNLIDNAVRHTPKDAGVTCRIVASEREIAFVIEDQGDGVPTELAERLFERFASARLGEGGIGLGLALVRTAAHRHGGRVVCTQAAGGGARFTLTLPRA